MASPFTFGKKDPRQQLMKQMNYQPSQTELNEAVNRRVAEQLLRRYEPPKQASLEDLGSGFERGIIPGIAEGAGQIGNYLINNPQGKQISAALLSGTAPAISQGLYQSGLADQRAYNQQVQQADLMNQRQAQLGQQYLQNLENTERANLAAGLKAQQDEKKLNIAEKKEQRALKKEEVAEKTHEKKEQRALKKEEVAEKTQQKAARGAYNSAKDVISGIDNLLKEESVRSETTGTEKTQPRYAKAVGSIQGRLAERALPGLEEEFGISQEIKTLLAQKALGTITQMKQASRTGATGFGAMNEKELSLIEADISSLDPRLSDKSFGESLKRIRKRMQRVMNSIEIPETVEETTEDTIQDSLGIL